MDSHGKVVFMLCVALTTLLSSVAYSATVRILVVGDSWAAPLVPNPPNNCAGSSIFDTVLAENGLSAYTVRGENTAWCGSHAAEWARTEVVANAPCLPRLLGDLEAHPEIDIVHMVIGGNDFHNTIATHLDSIRGLSDELRRFHFWEPIVEDIRIMIEGCLNVRPDIKVVLAGYDYFDHLRASGDPLNYTALGALSREEYIAWFTELGAMKRELVRTLRALPAYENRVEYLQNWGILQYYYDETPNSVPYPGQAPCYYPFPGGDPARTIPEICTFDGIHLYEPYYRAMLQNAIEKYYSRWLINAPADTTPPVITLYGNNPIHLACGEAYEEPGGYAIDNVDGDVSTCATLSGEVDVETEGSYTITYSTYDNAGNIAEVTREVIVECDDEGEGEVVLPDCSNTHGGFYQKGESFCLSAPELTHPMPSYTWFRDGVELIESEHIHGVHGRVLYIDGLTLADSGTYTCVYESPDKTPEEFGPAVVRVGVNVPGYTGWLLCLLVLLIADVAHRYTKRPPHYPGVLRRYAHMPKPARKSQETPVQDHPHLH